MSYNPFKLVWLSPDFKDGHIIQWEIDPVFADPAPHKFTVEVSGTPDFSEIAYSIIVEDQPLAIDFKKFKQAWDDNTWYRVRLDTEKGSYLSRTVLFGSSVELRRSYRLSREIMRKELVRMKFTGERGWLLKRKIFGKVEENSVDEVTGQVLTDNTFDFGVGLEEGYYQPLLFKFSVEDGQWERKLNEVGLGVTEKYIVKIRAIGYPAISTYDVIVDSENNQRFIVRDVQHTHLPGTAIALVQEITAHLLPNTDTVYQIPVTTNNFAV